MTGLLGTVAPSTLYSLTVVFEHSKMSTVTATLTPVSERLALLHQPVGLIPSQRLSQQLLVTKTLKPKSTHGNCSQEPSSTMVLLEKVLSKPIDLI